MISKPFAAVQKPRRRPRSDPPYRPIALCSSPNTFHPWRLCSTVPREKRPPLVFRGTMPEIRMQAASFFPQLHLSSEGVDMPLDPTRPLESAFELRSTLRLYSGETSKPAVQTAPVYRRPRSREAAVSRCRGRSAPADHRRQKALR